MAKAYVDHIDLIVGCDIVATYERSYKRDQVYMEINHYLPALERKPHAVTHASVVRQLPAIFGRVREKVTAARPQGYKDFLAVLLLLREYSVLDVAAALETLEPSEVNLASLRKTLDPKAVVLIETTDIMTTTEHAAQYDRLLQEVI